MEKKNNFKKLLPFVKPYIGLIILSIFFAILSTFGTIYLPIVIKDVINNALGQNNVFWDNIYPKLLLIIIINIVIALSSWLLGIINSRISFNISRDLRKSTFKYIQNIPLSYLDVHSSGDILSRLIQDVETISDGLLLGLTNLFTGNLMGVGQSLFDYGDSYQGEINAMNSGYSLTSSGSDSILDLSFMTGMTAYYQQPLEQYMEQLGHYFHLYGYAQNKMMTPSISNRKYWNYVKTSDVHLKVNHCPKEHLQTLKAIFDNGVTVWNMANGNMFENLNKDNVEV